MINIIITEFQKLKRYSILWIGVVAVLFSALLAVFQLTSVKGNEMLLYENYTNSVIWNNFSLAFPFTIVLIGGYIINREYADHTLKNMLTVPIPFRKLLTGKLIIVGLVTALYGLFSFICTFILGTLFCHENMTPSLVAKSFFQLVGLGFCCYLAVLPIITFFSRKQNGFLTGVGLAFAYGFCGVFVAGRNLTDFYPITAGLGIARYTGQDGAVYNPFIGVLILGLMIVFTMALIAFTPTYDKVTAVPKKKDKKHGKHQHK